jgi:4-hydroxybenzoate polyprenyltransferase
MLPATTDHVRTSLALHRMAVVHPVPSAISAVLVASLALVAGGEPVVAGLLAIAMLGFQVSIGALNDIVDAGRDRLAKTGKAIPAGLVSRRLTVGIVIVGGSVGLAISASYGTAVLVLGAAGYGSGLAYDIFMRRLGLGWLCFAAAFPLLLAWTWVAAVGALPPGWPFLLPLAALAGPAIHLANSLVDADADDRAGVPSLATQLGPQRARRTLAVLVAIVYLFGWATLAMLPAPSLPALTAALVATLAATVGVTLSWRDTSRAREAGWLLQASGLAILAVAWLASMSGA